MINTMKIEKQQGVFKKYKKWIVAFVGFQVIPLILLVCAVIGSIAYSYVNNGFFHSYKPYIISGFEDGFSDGVKNYISSAQDASRLALHNTPWRVYKDETRKLKEKVALEKEEYLSQFLESERGSKLAEMKINNIKLPLQLELELDKRFTRGLDFYADHVKHRVKREDFASDTKYQEALQDEAWKVGYEYGYYVGGSDNTEESGLLSLSG